MHSSTIYVALISAIALHAAAGQSVCPANPMDLGCACEDGYELRNPCRKLPNPNQKGKCCSCPYHLPPYGVVRTEGCEYHGMKTILDLDTCTELLRATYYSTVRPHAQLRARPPVHIANPSFRLRPPLRAARPKPKRRARQARVRQP